MMQGRNGRMDGGRIGLHICLVVFWPSGSAGLGLGARGSAMEDGRGKGEGGPLLSAIRTSEETTRLGRSNCTMGVTDIY